MTGPPFCLQLVAGDAWFSKEDWKSKESQLLQMSMASESSTSLEEHHVRIAVSGGESFGPNLPLSTLAALPQSFSLLWLDFEWPHIAIKEYTARAQPLPPRRETATPFQTLWMTLRGRETLSWEDRIIAPLKLACTGFWFRYFPSVTEVVLEVDVDPLQIRGVSAPCDVGEPTSSNPLCS